MTPIKRVHVVFGNPKKHLEELRNCARTGQRDEWTIIRSAAPGDRVVFYMAGPLTSFVALGTVVSKPKLNHGHSEWKKFHMANIADIEMLPSPVHLRDVRAALPEWGWLRGVRQMITVPSEFVGRFLARLGNAPKELKHSAVSDIEGIKTEAVHLTTKRSRRLRDLAFANAEGVCCVCDRDFSQLLDGRGVRALQVHHRRQLSALRIPRCTNLDDLAVVCANCHMLIHIDAEKPLAIEQLRKMLANEA